MQVLCRLADQVPVIFARPHPRPRRNRATLHCHNCRAAPARFAWLHRLSRPADPRVSGYHGLRRIQEETTFLGVPCLTVRENTERPITIEYGTNLLVGRDFNRLFTEAATILSGTRKPAVVPLLWDGRAADRLAASINSGS